MQITFLGQQGWMISSDGTTILVDPVLTDSFGTSERLRFSIYPPRHIATDRLGSIDAVCITNEHLDHFHLPSLKRLDRSVPILMGSMMPECIVHEVRNMGFQVMQCQHLAWQQVGNLNIQFSIGHENVPFWEKRVYHCYVTDKTGSHNVLIQSDTLLNETLVERIQQGLDPRPTVFIATNNAQLLPAELYGAFSNLLPLQNENQSFRGLAMLEEVLYTVPKQLGEVPYVLLSGGGYIKNDEGITPFALTNKDILQQVVEALALETKVYCLHPGEQLSFTHPPKVSTHPAIRIDTEFHSALQNRSTIGDPRRLEELVAPIFPEEGEMVINEGNITLIESELTDMAVGVLFSALGAKLLQTHEYLDGALGSERFLLQLKYGNNQTLNYVLNLATGCFEKLQKSIKQPITEYPYGIVLYASDFVALLKGYIQIWELATSNSRQWYLDNEKLSSPVAFLYEYFSEQIRPDLARKVYANLQAL